VHQKRQVVEHT